MKVKILKEHRANDEILDINVGKNMNIKVIKSLINENEKGKELSIEAPYFLIYNDIILNDNRVIEYYKIDPNKKIFAAKLENYLQRDHIVVEIFIMRFNPDRIHLIVKPCDTIAHIKLLLENIVADISNIWNMNGQLLAGNQSVADTANNGIDLKLIILCGDQIDIEFDKFCKIHDQFILYNYWRKYIFYDGWIRGDLFNSDRDILMALVDKWKLILLSDFTIDCKLEKNFLDFPVGFLNSRWLACEYLSEYIYGICDDYLKLVKQDIQLDGNSGFRDFIFDAIQCSILNSIKFRTADTAGIDKSIRTILTNGIDYLMNFINDPSFNGRYWMKLYVDEFMFAPSNTVDMNDITFDTYSDVKLHIDQCKYDITVPSTVETVIQLKKAISMLTGFSSDQMYLVKRGGDVKPDDNDRIDGIYNYFVEIVNSFDCLQDETSLGEGSFGTVFKYIDKETKSSIILKEQHLSNEDLYRDISIQSLIERSERFINRNRLIDKNGHICFTMDYMSLGSLKSLLETKKYFSEDQIAKISYQILKQIEYIHKRYIIHRDIKSENIVLDEHYNAKLIDFGLSKFTVGLSQTSLEERLKIYAPGTVLYMAPELLMDKPYTNKIDIWSFGIVMVEMATGNVPYSDLPQPVFIRNIKTKPFKYKASFHLSEELTNFIDCALKKDPNERFSAKQLIETKFIQASLKFFK